QPIQGVKLAIRRLEQNSLDKSILKELGKKSTISISQFHAFISAHRESKEWFVFYVKGKNRKLWAVRAYWGFIGGGWRVGAFPVSCPRRWSAGRQVVSQV
ncbi:MAG: hypothetical protein AAB556_02490, partial [Patescibacteria group bacterium]